MSYLLPSDSTAQRYAAVLLCVGLISCHGRSSRPEHQSRPSNPTAVATVLVPSQAASSDPSDAIYSPRNIGAGEKLPFILWLHGLGASGELFRVGLHVDDLANKYRFFYATPNGTADSMQRRFWNAGPFCCDLDGRGVDHVGRLSRILAEAAHKADVDPLRIFVVGFSNGGFMAHRLACSGAAPLAGIASMAGLGPGSAYPCTPSTAVRVLEIHGDADNVVRMEGGHLFDIAEYPAHPSLRKSLEFWLRHHHCSTREPSSTSVDLLPNLPGAETTQLKFANCNADVELWTIAGGGHTASNAPGVVSAVVRRLLDR